MPTDEHARFRPPALGADRRKPGRRSRAAEELGFDIVLAADHVGLGWAPTPTQAAIAATTTTIRLESLVLNNDLRNPVQLAWEASTLDR